MYICRLSSVSKIERTRFLPFLSLVFLSLVIYFILPMFNFLKLFSRIKVISSLYSLGRQNILIILGIYLILGLLARIFFIEKLQGPLKPFYAK